MPKLVRIKPGGNWYVSFTDGKRSRRITTGKTDKLEAHKFLIRVTAQLAKPPEPEQQIVSEYWMRILPTVRATSPHTRRLNFRSKS